MIGLTTVYFALFYAGSLLLILRLNRVFNRLAAMFVCSFFVVNPYLIAYFFSVYEEAFVLALVPLWCYLGVSAFQFEKRCDLFLLATMAIVASKSTLVVLLTVPAFLCLKYRRFRYVRLTVFVLAGSLAALAKSGALFDEPNSFNRLYNGLAYSLSDVSQWPSRESVARADQARILVRPETFQQTGLPAFALPEWGHSYYDDLPAESVADMAAYVSLGKKPAFAELLALNPHLAIKLVEQSVRTAIAADYTQSYHQQPNATDGAPEYQAIFQAAQRYLGRLLTAAAVLLALGGYRSNPFGAVLLSAAIVSPIVVVLGDGYAEFERHLLPFLILAALIHCRAGIRWRM